MAETITTLDRSLETPADAAPLRVPPRSAVSLLHQYVSEVFAAISRAAAPWSRVTFAALSSLVALWATLFYFTWAHWGDLTVDSGHEMYLPALLANGKMLYRDAWFMFGPVAPYLNSYLFRWFGIHLAVLYWAGSCAALASAVFLFLTGMRLGSWMIGWTAAAVLLLEAFEPGLFCFPLPYSFAAVYGCLCACAFLWMTLRAILSGRWVWMLAAATTASIALLLKLEFGSACYSVILLLIFAQCISQRSWKPLAMGIAASLPGIIGIAAVVRWMASIAGLSFITQQNFQSWPTAYFMRVYGKIWLKQTGFDLTSSALLASFGRVSMFAAVMIGPSLLLRGKRFERNFLLLALTLSAGILALISPLSFVNADMWASEHPVSLLLARLSIFTCIAISLNCLRRWLDRRLLLILGLGAAALACLPFTSLLRGALVLQRIFFPADMVVIVGLAAALAWWFVYARGFTGPNLAIAILFTFSSILPFRILFKMWPAGYPIYYTPPVLFSFLLLCSGLVAAGLCRSSIVSRHAERIVCSCCLLWVLGHAEVSIFPRKQLQPLSTERGVIFVPGQMAANYQKAIAFMKEKLAAGESVLSIPEDTSLYFLSSTTCPTRVYLFTPGVLVPGEMTEHTIQEMEQKKVKYLLWSNRTFPEYGVPEFGRDYDTVFAAYLRSHYRPLKNLAQDNEPGWNAVVWERTSPGI